MLSRSVLKRLLSQSWKFSGAVTIKCVSSHAPLLLACREDVTGALISMKYTNFRTFSTSSHATSRDQHAYKTAAETATTTATPKSLPYYKIENFDDLSSSVEPQELIYIEETECTYMLMEEHEDDRFKFVHESYNGIQVLLKFIQKSYHHNIRNFDQLTKVELVNCLYIFKNEYLNNKICSIPSEKFNWYNDMVFKFLLILQEDTEFPSNLPLKVIPKVEEFRTIEPMIIKGFGRFIHDLKLLDSELDFQKLKTFKDLSNKLDSTLKQAKQFPQHHNDPDSKYIRNSIQIKRYRKLQELLDKLPEEPIKDLQILVNCQFNYLFGDLGEINSTYFGEEFDLPYLDAIWKFLNSRFKFANYNSFFEAAPELFRIVKNNQLNGEFRSAAQDYLEYYISAIANGYVGFDEVDQYFNEKSTDIVTVKGKYFDNWVDNYAFEIMLQDKFSINWFKEAANSQFIFKNTNHIDVGSGDFWNLEYWEMVQEMESYLASPVKWIHEDFKNTVAQLPFINMVSFIHKVIQNKPAYNKLLAANISNKYDEVHNVPDGIELEVLKTTFFDFKRMYFKKRFKKFTVKQILAAADEFSQMNSETYSEFNADRFERMRLYVYSFLVNNKGTVKDLDLVVEDLIKYSKTVVEKAELEEARILGLSKPIGLSEYYNDLSEIFNDKEKLSKLSNEEILQRVRNRIKQPKDDEKDYYDEVFAYPENSYRIKSLAKLLEKLLSINININASSTMKEFLKDWKSFHLYYDEKKCLRCVTPYVQIPPQLNLHDHYKELDALRPFLRHKQYKYSDSEEILGFLDYKIDQTLYDKVQISSPVNKENIGNYFALHKKLEHLFDINGGDTFVLDALIHSQLSIQLKN
ncbi:uncharacterized protein RJT21DRAFT_8782 [Scheffersomyces amazonensis]|uniref:uncharacterized protein n=1 Tax=Scheffersomyces amazonensis TaxID=1078765 RepID=UPI00315CE052